MSNRPHKALLPAGIRDVLPPEAERAARTCEALMAIFASYGYGRVSPPLVEFEESLGLAAPGNPMSGRAFRLMDPMSQRMMAVRPDITLQIARIARARLAKEPRPLRLSYSGDVLRFLTEQVRAERQFGQIGVELIGADTPAADVEVIALAAAALDAIGIGRFSIDITSPTLIPALCAGLGVDGARGSELRAALDRKDLAAVSEAAGEHAGLFTALVEAAGPAARTVETMEKLDLPADARAAADRLADVTAQVAAARPGLPLTIDPVENRGFEYHTGISFTLFPRGARGELGSGGRYRAGGEDGEPATGFTLYRETIMRVLGEGPEPARLFLPAGTDAAEAARARADGWVALAALDPAPDAEAEARRLGCTHIWRGGQAVALD